MYEQVMDLGPVTRIPEYLPSPNRPAAPAALAALAALAYGTSASCFRTKNTPAFPPVTGMTPLSKYG